MSDSKGANDMARIVFVDDEPDIRAMLKDYFSSKGHQVGLAADGAALEALLTETEGWEVFVLDVGLPGKDGFGLARMLRERFDPAIMMLTGAGDLVDRVVGLEVGADDYLHKPVSLPELAARIEAVQRRRRPGVVASREVAFGPYMLDLAAFVLRDPTGAAIGLTAMEVDLAAAFATNPGRVLSRDDLMRLAPPRDEESADRSIDHRVTRLRRKLEEAPNYPQLIKTVRGLGYIYPG
jgi:DNA-binding response OmpR family regulator